MSRERLPWIPDPLDSYLITVVATYAIFFVGFANGWKYLQVGIISVYLLNAVWGIFLDFFADLTRSEKLQLFAQQFGLALLLIPPLLIVFVTSFHAGR